MSENKITLEFTAASIKTIDENLKGLASDIQNKVVGKAIFNAMDPALDEAQQRVSKKTGRLRDSLAKQRINEFDAPGAKIIARRGKQYGGHGNFAHLIEYGHRVLVRTKSGLRQVGHVPPRPYMRPALQDNAKQIVDFTGYYVGEYVNKFKGKD